MGRWGRMNHQTNIETIEKENSKISTIGVYASIQDFYMMNGYTIISPYNMYELTAATFIKDPPQQAKSKGYDVVCLSKDSADKKIYLYHNQKQPFSSVNLQLCDEDGKLITFLPCQKHEVNNYSISPLLRFIDEYNTLVKLHFATTESGITVIQAEYEEQATKFINTFIYAIDEKGINYDISKFDYIMQQQQDKLNIPQEHKNLPFLAKVSIYGDDFLKPFLIELSNQNTYKRS